MTDTDEIRRQRELREQYGPTRADWQRLTVHALRTTLAVAGLRVATAGVRGATTAINGLAGMMATAKIRKREHRLRSTQRAR